MRGFLKFIFSTLLVLGIPLLVFAALPRLNGYSTAKLQQQLAQQRIYDQVSTEIHDRTSNLEQPTTGDEDDPQAQITNLILSQITPAYLQLKTEDVTNQIDAWATGQTTTPPAVSLNDLQEQIKAQSPASQEQLNQILVELKQAQESNGGQLPQVSGDPESQAALEGLLQNGTNLDQLVNGNWTFSLEKPLANLPLAYKIYFYGLPFSGLLLLLCLVGLLLTGTTWPHRLKNVGVVLLIAGIWNGILAAVFNWGVMDRLVRMVPGLSEQGLGTSLVSVIRLSILDHYLSIQVIVTTILVVVGALLILIASLLGRSKSAKTAATSAELQAESKLESKPADKADPKPADHDEPTKAKSAKSSPDTSSSKT